ncbi:SPW repeat protein [Streptomyces sp. NPDC005202]
MTHNLIMGIAIGLLALGFTTAPARLYGLGSAMCAATAAKSAPRP